MAATTWFPAPTPLAAPDREHGGRARRPGLRTAPAARSARRGVAVALAGVALAGLVAAGVVVAAPATAGPATSAGVTHVVVAPGEALWDVAVRTAGPGVDPRIQYRDLVVLNGLDPATAPAPRSLLILPAR